MDLEKTIEFILENQAKTSAQVGEVSAQMGQLTAYVSQLQSLVGRIAQQQLELTQHMNEFQQGISAAFVALAEAQRHTDERMDALVAVVDDLVRRRPPQQ
ncbi:MAG: hypothetical protein HY238_27085 [Acidobacteria bacterium]|nr:hypothetical protein [Acidobacteriota bacterium]